MVFRPNPSLILWATGQFKRPKRVRPGGMSLARANHVLECPNPKPEEEERDVLCARKQGIVSCPEGMIVDGSCPFPPKRRKTDSFDSMDSDHPARAKFAEAKEKFGRELRVSETSPPTPTQSPATDNREETDDFYEFTPEDYYRLLGTKKEEKYLKTKKIRDAEEAARRSRMTKTIIRVRFPDNNTLDVTFHPSEKLQNLVDLLQKVLAQPDLPFYLYTTPPKKRIDDLSQDFFSAGFVPGAIVYFSIDLRKEEKLAVSETVSYLKEDVMALKGLEHIIEQEELVSCAPPQVEAVAPAPVAQERRPSEKKLVKPKWLKM